MPSFEYDILVHHVREDDTIARKIAERLRDAGLRVWLWEWMIGPPGYASGPFVDQARKARMMLLCLPEQHLSHKVIRDTILFREALNPERRFLPIRLGEYLSPWPEALTPRFDLHSEETREAEYVHLLETCKEFLNAPSRPTEFTVGTETRKAVPLPVSWNEMNVTIRSFAFSPDARYVLTTCGDDSIRLWDVETGACLCLFEEQTDMAEAIAWSADGRRAISGSADMAVRIWDTSNGHCLTVLKGHSYRRLSTRTESVLAVALNANGTLALSGATDLTMRLWNTETKSFLYAFSGQTWGVECVALSPDNRLAASGSGSGHALVRLWEIETGRCLRILKGHEWQIEALAFSPDSRGLLSCDGYGSLRLWDTKSGKCRHVLVSSGPAIRSVAWSPDNRFAISGDVHDRIYVWEVEAGSCLKVLEGHLAPVIALAWSGDNHTVFSADEEGIIRHWDVSEFYAEKPMSGPEGPVFRAGR